MSARRGESSVLLAFGSQRTKELDSPLAGSRLRLAAPTSKKPPGVPGGFLRTREGSVFACEGGWRWYETGRSYLLLTEQSDVELD